MRHTPDMNVLFIHQNFPGQFKHLAPALARQGHRVVALTPRVDSQKKWQGVTVLPYKIAVEHRQTAHPWLIDFESKIIRGEACWRAARRLKAAGFTPDVIVSHPGWGESLFLKRVWPEARMGVFCEFFYQAKEEFIYFDKELQEAPSEEHACTLDVKNLSILRHFDFADAGISPTRFQYDTHPARLREKISVIHDGIDTNTVKPKADAVFQREGTPRLTRDDEVITFVNRNLEPFRGYHIFLRSLPRLLAERPGAQVLIVGGDDVSYSKRREDGRSWKEVFIEEVRPTMPEADWARIHFLGRIPYPDFLSLLQVSRVHVYLTYPFVLSWSLLEAMSAQCAIVASDVAPVREVMAHDVTGRLVDFFDTEGLVAEVGALLDAPEDRARLGRAARAHVCETYDLATVCLPQQLAWVRALAGVPGP